MTVQAYLDQQLFALGREVLSELRGSLRPSRREMQATAKKLKIAQSLAWRAFNRYAFDNKPQLKRGN